MIFDATHGIAMLRRDRKVQYMVMEHYDKNHRAGGTGLAKAVETLF